MDAFLVDDYFPLVDYSFSDDDDDMETCEQEPTHLLNHTIESLISQITTSQQSYIEHLKCNRIRQGYIKRRVHMTLETEKGEEERRKSKLLQEAYKQTEESCRSPLKRVKMDTDVFRRFSPRRVTLIRKKRMCPPNAHVMLAQTTTLRPKGKRSMLQLLLKQGLCLNVRD